LSSLHFSKILIVDDSKVTRALIKKMFKEANIGYLFYEAKDGREAITQYIDHKPHLVIMDIVMPGINGIKATQAILKYDPKAQIIIFSSHGNKNIMDRTVKQLGALEYVNKSFISGEFIKTVTKHLTLITKPISKIKNHN